MIDVFWYFVSTLSFIAFIVSFTGFYRHVVHNKYVESEKRLRLKLNEANSYFRGDSEKVPEFMQKSIGDIGIEGIMKELGIDPGIMKNPLVKGLIEKYAPRVLEQLGKNAKQNTGNETGLL